ncbi:ankyrin repeat domain-containing protein [Endozoicomonas sp. YOMI1]|uniref:ankyrin repeat domain-containing protein n=1 Tax=Endozoicomonas sp. YOMI1 TaxID=2828739 RepID=UPI002147EADF|nr:ankyrin repeat domain-containing protein [Endozoicomonas sp. YOMI1]
MLLSNTNLQLLGYGKASDKTVLNDQTISDVRFADSSVATTNTLPQITTQERYAPISPADRIAGLSCQVINPDDSVSISGRNASESLKRSFNNDPGYESALCKLMKSESFTIPADRISQDDFIKTLLTAITDIDTSNAKRLISEYGATELSKYRCSFAFEGTTYPDITPFALACSLGKLDLVKELYVNQEQLNQTFDTTNDCTGQTSLMLARVNGHLEVVGQLLKWGAKPQSLDKNGDVVDVIDKVLRQEDTRKIIKNFVTELCITGELVLSKDSVLCLGSRNECSDGDNGCLNEEFVYLNPGYIERPHLVEDSRKTGGLFAKLLSE